MGTASTITKPKACINPPVQVPSVEFGRIFDRLMTAQRLALAAHRIAPKEFGITPPEGLLAWEIFLAVSTAVDELGQHAGYGIDEREPE